VSGIFLRFSFFYAPVASQTFLAALSEIVFCFLKMRFSISLFVLLALVFGTRELFPPEVNRRKKIIRLDAVSGFPVVLRDLLNKIYPHYLLTRILLSQVRLVPRSPISEPMVHVLLETRPETTSAFASVAAMKV
jgi:hypothetical protein